MSTYGNLDTSNWTSSFVSANRVECLRILSMINSADEQLIREKEYGDAIIGMKKICNGLIKMENEGLGDFDKQLILLALLIPAIAVFGLLDMDAPESTRREAALQYMLGMKTDPDHELASYYLIAKDRVNSYIADLMSGMPLEQFKRKYNFPADLFDALESLDRDFSVSSS